MKQHCLSRIYVSGIPQATNNVVTVQNEIPTANIIKQLQISKLKFPEQLTGKQG